MKKEGNIQQYTMIPDFSKLGFQLMALTFITIKGVFSALGNDPIEKTIGETLNLCLPPNVILFEKGIGLGHNAVMVSLHRDYSEYTKLIFSLREAPESAVNVESDVQSFLIDLQDKTHRLHMSLSSLANALKDRWKIDR